jgi:4-hydroxy-3-polyprenylbenzoate decarboxylase
MAYYKDLREHIAALEKAGKLRRIKSPINKDTELQPLMRWQFRGLPEEQRQALLYEDVRDVKGNKYRFPVILGCLAGSRDIYSIGLQCKPEEIGERWTAGQLHPIEPVLVPSGPCQEEVHMGPNLLEHGGLGEFPIPISTPGFDIAPYTTASHWCTKDPETGIRNMGNYRGQVKAPNRLGIYEAGAFSPPLQHIGIHWKKARERGQPLQAAVVIGVVPVLSYTAVAKIPYGVDEFAVSGGIAGEPIPLVKCKTVDLEVPATAELVIEGLISTEYFENEAPFGEYSGYMGAKTLTAYMDITAITHRKDMIYTGFISQMPPSESSKMRQLAYEHNFYKFLRYDCNIPAVLEVALHESSGSNMYLVIRMRKSNPSQPWQALNAAVAMDPIIGKVIIAVDEDIDPRDPDSVNWALSFCMQPHLDVRITHGKSSALDYSAAPPSVRLMADAAYPKPLGCSAMLIDATRKWAYTPVSLPAKEFMERAREIWEREGFPPLKPKVPWHGYNLGYWTEEEQEEAALALEGEHYKTGEKQASKRVRVDDVLPR